MRTSMTSSLRRPRILIALIIALAVALAGTIAFTTVRASAAPAVSIWGEGKPQGVVLDHDTLPVELGTSFTPAVDGQVTGVRFYKVKGMTGTHTGSLWSAQGTRLATVTFTKETASGWQTAVLSRPVAVKAGTKYVVSYRVPKGGRYATTVDFAGSSAATSLKVTHRNSGVYTYGKAGANPRSTWRSSQYWADVTFVAGKKPVNGGVPRPVPTSTPTPTKSTPATPSPTPSVTPTKTPTPTPTPKPTVSPTPTPTPTQTTPPTTTPSGGFPTRDSAGLPDGWQPAKTVTGDYYVRTAGAVVENLRVTNGSIIVQAANVTVRRVQFVGSSVLNGLGSTCYPGLVVQDSEFTPNGKTSDQDQPIIQFGGYTAKNIMVDGVPEGLRVGGSGIGCGAVTVSDSFIRVKSPDVCNDWHGDGIQGYEGGKLTVRNSTVIMQVVNNCWGTAPFFYPKGQGNTAVDIDGLLVSGGGYPFRNGMPGPVKNLNVVDGSWAFGPVDVNCSAVTAWSAKVVKLDASGQPSSTVRSISCTGQGN